jgi:glycine cleavage system regulatory protein
LFLTMLTAARPSIKNKLAEASAQSRCKVMAACEASSWATVL